MSVASLPQDNSLDNVPGVHPLQNKWVWWYSATTEVWDPKQVTTFSTVREFWELYNNIIQPSCLPAGSDFFVFKAGIDPAWEHEANRRGAQWSIELTRRNADEELIDDCWLWTLLAIIGDYFEDADQINGIVVSSRPRYVRIAVWIRDASMTDVRDRVCAQWTRNLNVDVRLNYKDFSQTST